MTNHWHGPHGTPEQSGCNNIECSDYRRESPLDMEVDEENGMLVLRLTPHQAEDFGWALRKAGGSSVFRKYSEWGWDLEQAGEALDDEPRPGVFIGMKEKA